MGSNKRVDLLKVSGDEETHRIEARLEGREGGSGKPFPPEFAAAGSNGNIRFADLRFSTDE